MHLTSAKKGFLSTILKQTSFSIIFQELNRQDAVSSRTQSPFQKLTNNLTSLSSSHLVTPAATDAMGNNRNEVFNMNGNNNLSKATSLSAAQLSNSNNAQNQMSKLNEIKWCFQSPVSGVNKYDVHNNNNNGSGNSKSDPKIAHKIGLATASSSSSSGGLASGRIGAAQNRLVNSVPNSALQSPVKRTTYPDCVYLRPEQNIPEIFSASTNFKPIGASRSGNAGSTSEGKNEGGKRRNSANVFGSAEENGLVGKPQQRISRDDLVVTMRSAQV